MRQSLLLFVAAAMLTILSAHSALGQRHEIPTLNSCIREFYDPEMYNYLTFKNSCTHSLSVVFVAKDGSGAGGTMDLRPGGKDSVGRLEGKVPKVGGFQLYVCQVGYVPLDDNQKIVKTPRSTYKCQPKT